MKNRIESGLGEPACTLFRLGPDSQRWPARRIDVAAPVDHREETARLKGSMRFVQQCQWVFDMQQIEDHDMPLRAIGHPRAMVDEVTNLGLDIRQACVLARCATRLTMLGSMSSAVTCPRVRLAAGKVKVP